MTGNLTTSQLPEIAILGLKEGLESESLLILGSLSKNDNSFEINQYFEKMIKELDIELPERRRAAIIYAQGIIDDILTGETEIIEGIYEIKNKAIDSFDFFSESQKYCYDSIGFEKIYGLFDEYFEVKECGSSWNKRKKGKLTSEIKSELFNELKKWEEKIKNGV